MKKILPISLVGILVLSGLGAAALSKDNTMQIQNTISFSSPIIYDDGNYVTIDLEYATSKVMSAGLPLLPKFVQVFDLPFGAKNVEIECVPLDIFEQQLEKDIVPAPQPMLLTDKLSKASSQVKDEKTCSSDELYPASWYDFRVTCGLNKNGEHVTHAIVHFYPVRNSPAEKKIVYTKAADIKITYEPPETLVAFDGEYDLLIIAPRKFSKDLQPLIDHKDSYGMQTMIKTTEEIYREYDGVDKPEKIKYFIKDAIEENGIKYVMLVGGLKRYLFANDRENANEGSRAWHVPARYTNLYDGGAVYDPGYLSDLYYSDIYKSGGDFSSWDTNEDGIFAAWGKPGTPKDSGIDLDPDVYVGRLACRNEVEVKLMVKKIISYETTSSEGWFEKMVVISGDGFQDQEDLDIEWDVGSLPDGEYTIYAQSQSNITKEWGPIDVVNITVDRTQVSSINFSENDHLKIDTYPGPAIAEITSPSEGSILGNTNVNFVPEEAYIGERWARVEYRNEIMMIRGKSYDPRPGGSNTTIQVWIENSNEEAVFETEKNSSVFFEGELETQKAFDYMPTSFEKNILWTSNGNFTNQDDVINAISEGSGFVYFAGHGSPRVWANHNPGIPGGRSGSSIVGLSNFDLWSTPFFPMNKLSNEDKLPVLLVGGCHNSQFNVSIIKTIIGPHTGGYWTYGVPIPESWSWWLTRLEGRRGAIATIGCTGLGYGILGKDCTERLGGWINPEFFRIVSEKLDQQEDVILGDVYGETIGNYISQFPTSSDKIDCKTVQEWALLGDPSLMLGGYS